MPASVSVFDQVQELTAKRNDVMSRLATDQKVLQRVPNTIKKREAQLAEIDKQLADLRTRVDGASNTQSQSATPTQSSASPSSGKQVPAKSGSGK